MPRRADAMVACARLALEVQKIALAHAPTAVGTVGRVEVEPNSPNVIPGVVRMTVDLRHHDDAVLQAMEAELYAAIERDRARTRRCEIETRKLHDLAADALPSRLRGGGAAGGRGAGPRAPRHHLGRRPRRRAPVAASRRRP